jgi:hypothetical protein
VGGAQLLLLLTLRPLRPINKASAVWPRARVTAAAHPLPRWSLPACPLPAIGKHHARHHHPPRPAAAAAAARPAGHFEFDFEETQLTEQLVRDMVLQEISCYHPEAF